MPDLLERDRVEAPTDAVRNVSRTRPIRISSPSRSGKTSLTGNPLQNVPFLLPRSSRTAFGPATTMHACRRDAEESAIQTAASSSRPRTFFPSDRSASWWPRRLCGDSRWRGRAHPPRDRTRRR